MTLLLIGNQPLPYAWGSDHLIQDLTGLGTIGEPAAELWFGSHKASPSQVLLGGSGSLEQVAPDLGFLVKFLAAKKPLSIQAHPSKARAAEQFGLGNQSYSDANHKPEMLIAISEFEALCGFRPEADIQLDLSSLASHNRVFVPWLEAFSAGGIRAALGFAFENNLADFLPESASVLGSIQRTLVTRLQEHFPGDVGVMIGAILLQQIVLAPGEALFMPAGNIHAYLKGLGVEVMAASDNVLRGGLTPKPIDVPELLQVLSFRALEDPRVKPVKLANGLVHYRCAAQEFSVYGVEVGGSNMLVDLELRGSMIVVCVSGEMEISTSQAEYLRLARGQAAYVSQARLFSITGSGAGYLAMG